MQVSFLQDNQSLCQNRVYLEHLQFTSLLLKIVHLLNICSASCYIVASQNNVD